MMMRTHIALGLLVGLAFLPYVTHKWIFFSVVLICSLLPDIDCMHSYLGRYWFFRPLQWCVKHRGMIHSLSFCLVITFGFALFVPVLALPFFLGYSLHLFGDALTVEGIRPWWPHEDEIKGRIRTGGIIENVLFTLFCAGGAVLAWRMFT